MLKGFSKSALPEGHLAQNLDGLCLEDTVDHWRLIYPSGGAPSQSDTTLDMTVEACQPGHACQPTNIVVDCFCQLPGRVGNK